MSQLRCVRIILHVMSHFSSRAFPAKPTWRFGPISAMKLARAGRGRASHQRAKYCRIYGGFRLPPFRYVPKMSRPIPRKSCRPEFRSNSHSRHRRIDRSEQYGVSPERDLPADREKAYIFKGAEEGGSRTLRRTLCPPGFEDRRQPCRMGLSRAFPGHPVWKSQHFRPHA